MTRSLSLTLALLATMGGAQAGPGPLANVICSPGGQMQTRLQQTLRATRLWQGVRSPDQVMELWADDRGGWILVAVHASGNSCILAMGLPEGGFEDLAQG